MAHAAAQVSQRSPKAKREVVQRKTVGDYIQAWEMLAVRGGERGARDRYSDMKPKHGPIYPKEILYPIIRPERAEAIAKAVRRVVSRMKPQSLCYCGKECAVSRKLRQARSQ